MQTENSGEFDLGDNSQNGYWKKLIQARGDLKNEGGALLRSKTRTETDDARMTEITAALEELSPYIDAEEGRRERLRNEPPLGGIPQGQAPGRRAGTGPRYAEMFGRNNLDTAGFRSFGEFALAVDKGLWSAGMRALMTGGDTTGTGLMIPPQYASELWDMSLENEVVRPRARIEPMTSDIKTIAGLTHDDGRDAPFGISGGWTTAGAEITPDDAIVRAISLYAHKLAMLLQISSEAASDGTAIDQQLTVAMSRGLGWLLDKAFLTGTGVGMPMGVLVSPATVSVAKEVDQTPGTIVAENLDKMFSRMAPGSVNNSVWIINNSAIPQLLGLYRGMALGGEVIPVLNQTGGTFTILTRPVVFTEKLPALGTKGDVLFADLSQYVVGLRQEIVIEKSVTPGFTRDTIYYRGKVRAAGMSTWAAAYTPLNGLSLSPFVTLDARP
jgi:HK97 family phage major capsid protein